MCVFCGVPNPTHDELIVRGLLLASTSSGLLMPRRWLRGAVAAVARSRPANAARALLACIR